MGHHDTTRRKSSFHFTAEAYLAFGIGLARRASRTERRSSYVGRRSSKSKSSHSYSKSSSSSPSFSRKPKRASSPSRQQSKPATLYPCYHRIVTPEPSHQYQYEHQTDSLHNFCIASDATYARLAARLERLRKHEDDIVAYLRERSDRGGLGRVAEGLREEVGRLEGFLEAMRRKIEEGEGGWDGSGEAFLVGGRWATFL